MRSSGVGGDTSSSSSSAKLDAYLRGVESLFYASPDHYDEEKALEVLHRCNYDTVQALELLQPWARVEEDGDADGLARDAAQEKKEFESDDACAVCGDGGDLIICDAKGCKRVYHAVCAELAEIPSGQWECAVHFCHTCGQRVNDANSVRCSACPTSFCAAHIPACQSTRDKLKPARSVADAAAMPRGRLWDVARELSPSPWPAAAHAVESADS